MVTNPLGDANYRKHPDIRVRSLKRAFCAVSAP